MSRYIDADVRVGVPIKEAVIIEKTELTDECIDKIAEAVVQKLADRKTEPQTDAFTKWAKSVADSYRDEPQTEVKVEPTWVGVTYGRFEDKPHTERSEQ